MIITYLIFHILVPFHCFHEIPCGNSNNKLYKKPLHNLNYNVKGKIIWNLSEIKKDVIEYGKGTLLVEAGPGSGKTTVIVERIKHLINNEGGLSLNLFSYHFYKQGCR